MRSKLADAFNRISTRLGDLWGRPSSQEVAVCLQLMGLMLSSGVDLTLVFDSLQQQVENARLRSALADVESKVTRWGWKLAAAMAEQNGLFPYYVILMVQAGEESGQVAQRLIRSGQLMERSAQRGARVRAALTSPAITFSAASLVILLIARYVMPRFAEMYNGLNIPLPHVTRLALAMVAAVNHWTFPVVVFATLGVVYRQRLLFREQLFEWSLGFGPARRWVGVVLAVEFCGILGSLVGEGVALARALTLIADRAPFTSHQSRLRAVHKELVSEGDFSESLRHVPYFPRSVYSMLAVAQEAGSMETLLAAVKTTLEQEMEVVVEAVLTLLEPALIGGLGAFTAFFFLAMFIPIYGTLQGL